MLLLALASCSKAEPDHVTITPTLACTSEVRCHVYEWQLGPSRHIGVLRVGGTHIRCHCDTKK